MQRMDRVGRKKAISRVLYQEFKRHGDTWITAGRVANRMGGKASSHIKKMCEELVDEDDNIMYAVFGDEKRFGWRPVKQLPLPERYIVINGKSHKVANWVGSKEEFENA